MLYATLHQNQTKHGHVKLFSVKFLINYSYVIIFHKQNSFRNDLLQITRELAVRLTYFSFQWQCFVLLITWKIKCKSRADLKIFNFIFPNGRLYGVNIIM